MPGSEFTDLKGPVHYWDHGGDGPALVLVHGLGASYLSWNRIAPELTDRYHVYAIDLAGFGLTPPAGRKTTVQANQELLGLFCDEVSPGEPVVLIGNSMGGLITMLQASAHPKRVAAAVLINPALPLVDLGGVNPFTLQRLIVPSMPGIGSIAMRRYYATTTPEDQIEETLDAICVDPSVVRPEDRAATIEMQRLRRDMDWAVPSFAAASRSIASTLTRRGKFAKMLHKITAPTLLIHGDQDRLVAPASAQWAARERPDWQFRMFHGVGHVPMIERPDTFIDLVRDFLSEAGP